MEWSIKDIDQWSDELKAIVALITGGHIPGRSIKEEEEYE
jgi:hypothetical protein